MEGAHGNNAPQTRAHFAETQPASAAFADAIMCARSSLRLPARSSSLSPLSLSVSHTLALSPATHTPLTVCGVASGVPDFDGGRPVKAPHTCHAKTTTRVSSPSAALRLSSRRGRSSNKAAAQATPSNKAVVPQLFLWLAKRLSNLPVSISCVVTHAQAVVGTVGTWLAPRTCAWRAAAEAPWTARRSA